MINSPEFKNIRKFEQLLSPNELKHKYPLTDTIRKTVTSATESIENILQKEDPRPIIIAGPCSIHDMQSALDYAAKLNELRKKYQDSLYIVMRTYFEKPRTTIGWKGFINDPHLDETYDLHEGLRRARALLIEITSMGLPCATEFVDPFVPPYIADLISWAAIGARSVESQIHRAMASSLPMPVGFKNNTEGNVLVAINAMQAARYPQILFGLDQDGRGSLVRTSGNTWGHIILRGSDKEPNYDRKDIQTTLIKLREKGFPTTIMVDCSHGNSAKKAQNQEIVWKDVINQRKEGDLSLIGLMLESNIHAGSQKIPAALSQLKPGISITDECLSLEATTTLFDYAANHWVRCHPDTWCV